MNEEQNLIQSRKADSDSRNARNLHSSSKVVPIEKTDSKYGNQHPDSKSSEQFFDKNNILKFDKQIEEQKQEVQRSNYKIELDNIEEMKGRYPSENSTPNRLDKVGGWNFKPLAWSDKFSGTKISSESACLNDPNLGRADW